MMQTWPGMIEVPDIIEFTCSDRYLNRPNLYPRQATLLKVIFLQEETMTQYDYDVLEEWTEGFILDPDKAKDVMRYQGNNGIQPDVLDRIKINRDAGRKWFREVDAVIGRRGSKGYIGGISGAYVLWHYLSLTDPQGHYGVARDKRLSGMVFAGKKEQAKANQWKDLTNIILGSECFAPFISRAQTESLTIFSPQDRHRILDLERKGIETDVDLATFEILPKESTGMSGRGPAAFLQFYDEMAHIVKGVAKSDAGEVYGSATPALDQFGLDGFIYAGSSPWQMLGQFYENYQNSLEVESDTHEPVYPEMLMVQLTSWDPYEDWERAEHLLARPERQVMKTLPDGEVRDVVLPAIAFEPLQGAIQTYDDQLRKLERANPEGFAVERRSQWATAMDAYLNPTRVEEMFAPWNGRVLQMQTHGILSVTYKAHGDPAKSGDRFGFAIAHTEMGEDGYNHVVFDYITAFDPTDDTWAKRDEEGNTIRELDYALVEAELWRLITAFTPDEVTFDQWNSASVIDRFQARLLSKPFPKRIVVEERTSTRTRNWKVAEVFKTALGMGLISSPYHEILEQEAIFLQERNGRVDHPTSGPVKSKDVWDCVSECVYSLIGEQMHAFLGQTLAALPMVAGQPGGTDPFPRTRDTTEDVHGALSGFSRSRGVREGMRPGGASRRRR
jgi:hypothetical protein